MSRSNTADVASLPLTRRVVTGGNEPTTKSEVLYDDAKGSVKILPNASRRQTLWTTNEVPADCSSVTSNDPTITQRFGGHNNGSVCVMVTMRPGSSAPMHQTKNIGYGIVLEGELVIQLENGDERLLKTGDVIVQRETVHAYHNRHPTAFVKMFTVMIATKNAKSNNV